MIQQFIKSVLKFQKTKSTHFCGENKKYALLRRISERIFQNKRKIMRGYSCIIQKNWCFYVFANKKYAFLRRKQKVRIFAEKKSMHFRGENKKYAFSWRIFQIKMDISVWKIVYHMTGKERGKNGAGMDKRDISQCVRNLQYNGLPALYALPEK